MVTYSQKYLEFLFGLYSDGYLLPEEQIDVLKKNDFIKVTKVDVPELPEEKHELPEATVKTEEERLFDDGIKIVITKDYSFAGDDISIFDPKNHVNTQFLEVNNITKKDWIPKDIVYHELDFVDWVDSFTFGGFQNMVLYNKFELYKKQAYDWLHENDTLSSYVYPEDISEFKQRECDRGSENSLYACNKYGKVKDATIEGGWRKWTATPAHEVMCYLDDCGYSYLMGKGRQIAATSTLSLLANLSIIFRKNFFIKFITEDEGKGLEIYRDKIKASFTAWPEWMCPDVQNWTGTHLKLGNKGDRKGRDEGVGSSILVDAPSITAIAGGSPNKALVDESGNIQIFSQMKQDSDPTMYSQDPNTGKIRMTRQFIAWGTGGDMEKGGKSFEFEYMVCVEQWKERKWGSGLIPIFFDWTCRPGITQEFYNQKKEEAFTATGPDAAKKRIKFYQQYPSTIEDMFLSSQTTLVDIDWIHAQEKRIDNIPAQSKSEYGYFEPEFDAAQPMPEGFHFPFKVIGAKFIKTEPSDPRATTIIFQHPHKDWTDRYYQGDDPIAAESGLSNMASAIWDDEYKTISAIVDSRDQNYKNTFAQCLLLGIYYDLDNKKGPPDLLEANTGAAYRDFKEVNGFFKTLIYTTELPLQLQNKTGGQMIGIDNKGTRNKLIIDKMFEMFHAYGERFYIRRPFEQLKTFTCKETDAGGVTWGPVNRKFHKDDVLWAMVYAYIARQCYPNRYPVRKNYEGKTTKLYYPVVRDKNHKLTRRPVKIKE